MHQANTTNAGMKELLVSCEETLKLGQCECYWLGPNAWALGRTVDPSLRVREVARSIMQQLRDRFGETINLGVLHGDEVVYLEMAVSR